MLDDEELESEADWILRSRGFLPDEAPSGLEIARALQLRVIYGSGPELLGDAVLEGATIRIRRRLSRARRDFVIAHEIAEYFLLRRGYQGADIEDRADRLAAALILPRVAFRTAVREIGECVWALAAEFGTTETAAALRIGEVMGRPVAVVAPHRVRIRGEAWGWPEGESALRRMTRLPPPRGVLRVGLRDDRRRVALLVCDAGF